jgi:hypothetical protein
LENENSKNRGDTNTKMKVEFKTATERFVVDFKITPNPSKGEPDFIAMASNSKELDKLQDYISKRGAGDASIGAVIAKVVEKKLGIPMEKTYGYQGAGFGIHIDTFALAKKLG